MEVADVRERLLIVAVDEKGERDRLRVEGILGRLGREDGVEGERGK